MTEPRKLAGRFQIVKEQVAEEDLRRWAAQDLQSGDDVEVVAPRSHALLREGARGAFARVPLTHPAVHPVLARVEEEGVPYVVRPRTQGTLAGVRLTPGDAQALLGWLVPAVLEGNGCFHGELRGEDVVVDHEGTPRLAAVCLPRPESLARVPHHRAPELLDHHGEPDAAADLFGLGVLVYRAVAGQDPWPAQSAAQLRRRDTPAPPLSGHAPVPEALEQLVAGLVDLDPEQRLAAARQVVYSTPPVLTPAPLHDAPAAVRVHPTRPDPTERPEWVAVVPLAGLSPAALLNVAVRSGVEPVAVQRAAARKADWILDQSDAEGDVLRVVRRMETRGLPARAQATSAPAVAQWLVLALIALGIAVFAPFPVNLAIGALAAALVGWTVRNVLRSVPVARARTALRDRAQAPASAGAEVRALGLERRLREAENLPAPVRHDIRDAIDGSLDRLVDLALADAELPPEDLLGRGRVYAERDQIAHALARLEFEFGRAGADANLDPSSPRVGELGQLARSIAER